MKKGDWQGLGMLFGMLVIFLGVIFLIPKRDQVSVFSTQEMPTAQVEVLNQTTDGLLIKVSTERAGFLSLHRAMGAAPGEILRQVKVPEGAQREVLVPAEGLEGPVIVLLFADDGDGVFEIGQDLPVVRDGLSVRAETILRNSGL